MQVRFDSTGASITNNGELIGYMDRQFMLVVFAKPQNQITRFHTKPSESEILMAVDHLLTELEASVH